MMTDPEYIARVKAEKEAKRLKKLESTQGQEDVKK